MTTAFQIRPQDRHILAGQEDLGNLPGVLRHPDKNLFSLAADPSLAVGRPKITYYAGGAQLPIAVDVAPEQYQKFITSTKSGEWGIRSRWGQYDAAKTFLEAALTADLPQVDAAARTEVQNGLADMRKFRLFSGGSKGKVLCFLARLVGEAHLRPAAARRVLAILAKPENRKDYTQLAGTNPVYVALLAALREIPGNELQSLSQADNDGSRGIGLLQRAVLQIIQERRRTGGGAPPPQQPGQPPPPPPGQSPLPAATLNAPPPPPRPGTHTPSGGQPLPPAKPAGAPPPPPQQPPRPPPAAVPPPPPPPMPLAEFGRRFMDICRPFMAREGVHPRARAGFEIICRSLETPAPDLPTDPHIQARMREELAIFWSHAIATASREDHVNILRRLFGERVAEPLSPLFTFVRENAFKINDKYHYVHEDMAVLGHIYEEKLARIPGHIPTRFQLPIFIDIRHRFDDLQYLLRVKKDIENALHGRNPLAEAQQSVEPGAVYQLAFPILRSEHWVGVLLRVTRGETPEKYTCQFEILSSTIHRAEDPEALLRVETDLKFIIPALALVLKIDAPDTVNCPPLLKPVKPPKYQQPDGTSSDCGPCVLANFFHAGLPPGQEAAHDEGSGDQMLPPGRKMNTLRYRQIEMACRSQIPTSFTGRFLQQNERLDAAGDAVPTAVPAFRQPPDQPAGNPFPALRALEEWQLAQQRPPLPPPPPPPAVIVAPPPAASQQRPQQPPPQDHSTPSAPPPPPDPATSQPARPPTPPSNPAGTTTVPPGQDPLSQGSGR